ncbi:DNA replication and repair protein RecO [Eubacterium aggregans]|uniref:DNA repair protein RecO n=1 Tax=Eubacterium aggregans TaxID=81409 RepID=A0A1H4C839_9FIRM|nr:DNA repair protein RecO [Eubacterium aggregans]SEA56500.1 DNA replication and repair protein RecO [Eubacterium aggregans]
MAQVKTRALVIREQPFQEQDKILTLFTEKEGKQKAIAKGVRRSKSQLVAATQLFSFSEFVYYPGKNFAAINQATLVEAFYPLRQDLLKMSLASYILELLDAFYDFYQGNPAVLKVANHILYYLSQGQAVSDTALVAAFQLKIAEAQGIRPILSACAHCKKTEELIYFSIDGGGAICRDCSGDEGYTYRLLSEQLSVMETLLIKPIKVIRDMDLPDETIRRIMDIMDHYISFNLDKKLSAYQFYKDVVGN